MYKYSRKWRYMNHPAFKLYIAAIAAALVVLWVFLIHIGTDYWYVYLPIGLLITAYTLWYVTEGVKRIRKLEKFIKMFLPGRTTTIHELSLGNPEAEVISSLKSGCFGYIQNVYAHRVQHILKAEALNRIERVYFEVLAEHLGRLENLTSSESNEMLAQFYEFNFNLLTYRCDSDAAQECLETGEHIQEFIWEFHLKELQDDEDPDS